MSNEIRLIDANALKAEVNKKNVVGRFNTLVLIDNAPTVERTQSKWKKIGEEYYNWSNHDVIKCLHCGYVKRTACEVYPHFCEDCGADMRGGRE